MNMLKKLVSFVLAVTMLSSSCLAYTLNLPSGIITIEEEAFYGDTSLDEVYIPSGAETIGFGAFGESSIREINIPDTVVNIDDDAFAGSPDVVIVSSEDAYAHQYAEERGISWKNINNLDIEFIQDRDLSPISLDGVTDPELIADIENFNNNLYDLQSANDGFRYAVRDLNTTLDECAEALSDLFSGGNNGSLQIANEINVSGLSTMDILSTASLGEIEFDGNQFRIGINGNTDSVYCNVTDSGITFSATASFNIQPRVTDDTEQLSTKLDRASQHISSVLEPIRSWFENIDYAAKSVEAGSATLYEAAKTACREGSSHPIISKVRDEAKDTYQWINEKSLDPAKPRILRTKATAKVLFGISIVAEVLDYIHALEYDLSIAEDLRSIVYHEHPTEQDQLSESAMETAQSLNSLLKEYIGYFLIHTAIYSIKIAIACNKLADSVAASVSAVAAPVSAPFTVAALTKLMLECAIDAGIKKIGEIMERHAGENLKRIKRYEESLHGRVFGTVRDYFTLEPLEGVLVSTEGKRAFTDNNGEFVLLLNNPSLSDIEVTYQREDYTTKKYTTEIYKGGFGTEASMLLIPYIPVYGTVFAKEKDNLVTPPLSGVDVYLKYEGTQTLCAQTNNNGEYTAYVPAGEFTLAFDKEEYLYTEKTFYCELNSPNNSMNIYIDKIPTYVISGTVSNPDGPVSNVEISVGEKNYYTDNNGYYSLSLIEGEYSISFYKYGYVPETLKTVLDKDLETNIVLYTAVPIDENHFPSTIFRDYLRDKFDIDGNNVLEISEIEKIEAIYFPTPYYDYSDESGISLEGIEYFFDLKYLSCYIYNLTSLDLRSCRSLKKLTFNTNKYARNKFKELKVSGNKTIESLELNDKCYLKSLDVSGCSSLSTLKIYDTRIVESIDNRYNKLFSGLESLNLKGAYNLKEIYCYNNNISKLDLIDCKKLEYIDCSYNNLSKLDLSMCHSVKKVVCRWNYINKINLCDCSKLACLFTECNEIFNLDISTNPILLQLYDYNDSEHILGKSGGWYGYYPEYEDNSDSGNDDPWYSKYWYTKGYTSCLQVDSNVTIITSPTAGDGYSGGGGSSW